MESREANDNNGETLWREELAEDVKSNSKKLDLRACLTNNRTEQSSGLLVLELVKSNDVI